MKTKQINLYEYDELSDEAQRKALEDFVEHNDYYFLEESLSEYLNQLLEENKVKVFDKKVFYSLGNCQGDGLGFEGNFEFKGININVKHDNGHYYHKNSFNIEVEEVEEDNDDLRTDTLEVLREGIEEDFKELYNNLCDIVEKSGYSEIEHENSEDAFKEYCENNEAFFKENGEREF